MTLFIFNFGQCDIPISSPICLTDIKTDITAVRSLTEVTRAMSAKRAAPAPEPRPATVQQKQLSQPLIILNTTEVTKPQICNATAESTQSNKVQQHKCHFIME